MVDPVLSRHVEAASLHRVHHHWVEHRLGLLIPLLPVVVLRSVVVVVSLLVEALVGLRLLHLPFASILL